VAEMKILFLKLLKSSKPGYKIGSFRSLSIIIGLVLLIIFVCCQALLMIDYYRGGWRWVHEINTSLTELYLCDGAEQPKQFPYVVSDETSVLDICGTLETNFPVILNFYVYSINEPTPVSSNPPGQLFDDGTFIIQLNLPEDVHIGLYRIDVWLRRAVIGQLEFEIR
jgi:hypothetical protein